VFHKSRALIKYGYSKFFVRDIRILRYCYLTEREPYYLYKLNPRYNTLKITASSLGYKHTEETKIQVSKSLKGIYIKAKSSLYGRTPYSVLRTEYSFALIQSSNVFFFWVNQI